MARSAAAACTAGAMLAPGPALAAVEVAPAILGTGGALLTLAVVFLLTLLVQSRGRLKAAEREVRALEAVVGRQETFITSSSDAFHAWLAGDGPEVTSPQLGRLLGLAP
ncbi:MAG: hypothetical protein ACREGL_05465, partial [Alphaproteobacteria bacterium]